MNYVCIFLACLAGAGVARVLFPAPLRWSLHNAWVLSLGGGAGIAIASSLYFLCLALIGPNFALLAAVEGVFVLTAAALAIALKKQGPVFEWAAGPEPPGYLTIGLLLAAAIALGIFVSSSIYKPHGEWDAWSIWNLRARFLYRGGDSWRDAFSPFIPWAHPDYPLLIPGIVAMSWTLSHLESTAAPIATAFVFTFGLAGLFIATIGILRGKAQAYVAGILLLGTVSVSQVGAYQYADVPLGFFFLASLALLCLQDRHPEETRFTVLAGLAAGFGAWTKNEGLLFAAVLLVARAIAIFRYGRRPTLLAQIGRLVAGMVAPLAMFAFFKIRYAPSNDLLSTPAGEALKRLVNIGRWLTTFEGLVPNLFRIGSFLLPVILVLALYWYLVRFKVEERDRSALGTVVLAVALMMAGNIGVYIMLAPDVEWQVRTSIERLYLQLWAPALLAFFLAANPPQLVARETTVEKEKKGKPAKRSAKQPRRGVETR